MHNRNKEHYIDFYIDKGFCLTALEGKAPFRKGWQGECLSPPEIRAILLAEEHYNIGVVLGDQSDGLIDVDLDDPLAVEIASDFLPPTSMKFGRGAKDRHYIYQVPTAGRTTQFQGRSGTIAEVRGNGGQTMFPGSVHPDTGEAILFSSDGAPAAVEWTQLLKGTRNLSIAVMALPHWKEGQRHHLSVSLAGLLARSGWAQDEVAELIAKIASRAQDEEFDDRLRCVDTTFNAIRNGYPVAGYRRLADLIGDEAAILSRWVGNQSSDEKQSALGEMSTDAHCAKAFADHNKGYLYYSYKDKRWLTRESGILVESSQELIQRRVINAGQALLLNNDATLNIVSKKFMSVSGINNIIQLSRSELSVDSEEFDADPDIIGCQNGVLSLRERRIVEPLSLVTKKLGANFSPSAVCPTFEKFVGEVFDGDDDVTSYFQRAVGYSLSGGTEEQCMFIMLGSGANGKSTAINVLSDLFGEYGGNTPMHTLMVQKSGNSSTNDLAALVGKRFVAASESDVGARLAESKIKSMTGGDKIVCRHLYQDFFSYIPMFKIWLGLNDLPKIEGTGESIWRRFQVIEFPVTFNLEKRDKELSRKLRKELPGILNWALDGYRMWREQGLNPPEKVLSATDQYRTENDTVRQFVEICCDRDVRKRETTSVLYARYESWSAANGLDPLPKARFGKELSRLGFEGYRMANGNGWKGLSLKPEAVVF